MNKIFYFLISVLAAAGGIFYYALVHEWIIIRHPQAIAYHTQAPHVTRKKKITLYYYQNKWMAEPEELIWSPIGDEQIATVVHAWLKLHAQELIIDKKVSLQSVLLDNANTAYISFDHPFLPKQSSIHAKLMIIQSLLKTLKENNIKIQAIYFLIGHQPMLDYHLDFSKPWPITGFLS